MVAVLFLASCGKKASVNVQATNSFPTSVDSTTIPGGATVVPVVVVVPTATDLTFFPSALNFAGATNPSVLRTVVVTNPTAKPAQFSSIGTSTNPFAIVGGTCVLVARLLSGSALYAPDFTNAGSFSMPANTSCTINVSGSIASASLVNESVSLQVSFTAGIYKQYFIPLIGN